MAWAVLHGARLGLALWIVAAGVARADDPEDKRLLFDPAALGSPAQIFSRAAPRVRTPARPSVPGRDASPSAQVRQRPPSTAARVAAPQAHPSRPVLSALPRTKPGDDASPTGGSVLNGFKVGEFSIGFETETNYKPRSPSGEELTAASYEAPHSGLVVPFIGLSAKSAIR
jgi:hypothetical protein